MINFLKEKSIEVEWNKDLSQLGTYVDELSPNQYCGGVVINGNFVAQGKDKVAGGLPGRPAERSIKCKVCRKVIGPTGMFKSHFEHTHMTSTKYAHLPKNGVNKRTCPVQGCIKADLLTRRAFSKHLKNEEAHTTRDLLNSGVQAWFYRDPTDKSVIEVLRWLRSENLVELISCPEGIDFDTDTIMTSTTCKRENKRVTKQKVAGEFWVLPCTSFNKKVITWKVADQF